MDSVCRTCMRIIDKQEEIVSINNTELLDKLRVCLPELILDNVVDPKMCSSCSAALSLSFRFKEMCHQAEQTINKSLQNKSSDGEIKPLNEFELLTLGHREIEETDDDTDIKSLLITDNKVQILSKVDSPKTPQESFTNNWDDEIKSVRIERTSRHAEKIIVMPEDSIEEDIDIFISTNCTVYEPNCEYIDDTTGDIISTDYKSPTQSIKLEEPSLAQISPLQAVDYEEKQMLVDITAQSTSSFDNYEETVSPKKSPVNPKSAIQDETDKLQLNRTNKSCRRTILTGTKLSEPLKMAEHQTRSAVKLLGDHQNTNGNSEIVNKGLLKTDTIKTELGVGTPKNSVARKKDSNQTECKPKVSSKKETVLPINAREGKTLEISPAKQVKSSTNVTSSTCITQKTTGRVKPKLSKSEIIDKKVVGKSRKLKHVKVEFVNKTQSKNRQRISATTELAVQNTNLTKNYAKSVIVVAKTKVQNKTNKGDRTVIQKSVQKRKREQSPKISNTLRKRSCSEPKTDEGQIDNSDNMQDDVANALQQLLQTSEYKNILQIQTSSEHHLVKSGIVAKTLQQVETTIKQQIPTKVQTPTPNLCKLVAQKSTNGMLKFGVQSPKISKSDQKRSLNEPKTNEGQIANTDNIKDDVSNALQQLLQTPEYKNILQIQTSSKHHLIKSGIVAKTLQQVEKTIKKQIPTKVKIPTPNRPKLVAKKSTKGMLKFGVQSPKIFNSVRKRSPSESKTNEVQIANSDDIQDDVQNTLQQLLQTPEYKNILQMQTSSEHHLVKSGIVAKTLQQVEKTIKQQIRTKVETPTPNRRKLVAKKSTKGMLKFAVQSPKISKPIRKRSRSEPKSNEGQIPNSDHMQDDVANALQQLLQTPEYKNILQIQTSSEHHLVKSGIVAKTLQQVEKTIKQQIPTKVETPTPNRHKLVAKKSTKAMLKLARRIQALKEIDLDLAEINDGVQQQKLALAANRNQVLNDKGVSPLQTQALHTECEPVAEKIKTIDVSEVNDGRKSRKINFQRCKTCGRVLKSISQLNIHLRSHILEKSFVCELCGKSFSLQRNLLSHTMLHFTAGNHQCTICEKHFSSAFVLKKHMLIHTGEKPYVCIVCDNRFTQKVNLKMHMVLHTGARDFICNLCNSAFTQKIHLVTHMMTHTGERPYTCDLCPKAFSKSYILKCHKQAHQRKPYQCDICLCCFSNKKSMQCHFRRCKNSGSYLKPSRYDDHRCGTCSRLFSSKFSRDRHLKVHVSDLIKSST